MSKFQQMLDTINENETNAITVNGEMLQKTINDLHMFTDLTDSDAVSKLIIKTIQSLRKMQYGY